MRNSHKLRRGSHNTAVGGTAAPVQHAQLEVTSYDIATNTHLLLSGATITVVSLDFSRRFRSSRLYIMETTDMKMKQHYINFVVKEKDMKKTVACKLHFRHLVYSSAP